MRPVSNPVAILAAALLSITLAIPAFAQSTPPGLKTFRGRRVANYMHHTGAPWLIRASRAKEENTDLLLKALNIKPGQTVCDLGCGNGYHTLRMAKKVGVDGLVYGVDIQQEMLDKLMRRTRAAGIKNVMPVKGTVADPKLPPGSCDLILLVDVYHEFSHPEHMLAGMRKALKPSGRLVLVEFRSEDAAVPIKYLHKMSLRQMIKEVPPVGFRAAEVYRELPWQHAVFYQPAPREKLRVLFIGDGHTSANDLPARVRTLAGEAEVKMTVETIAPDGATLKSHWENEATRAKIRNGKWDVVVLQGQGLNPVVNPDEMRTYARKLHNEVNRAGARTVLSMTWPRKDRPGLYQRARTVYESMADELGAELAPVGRAWSSALHDEPTLGLFADDGSSPSEAGTYLAACVLSATITGRELAGSSSADLNLKGKIRVLQTAAWKAVNTRPVYATHQR